MPGHKLGKGIPPEFLENLACLDLTEIPETDNLHFPTGPIKEAQQLAARAFGAQHSFFLVNGSTCGIQSIIMTICKPGDKLIVSRDCHKSVINSMMLAGARPVYIKPQFERNFGIPGVVEPRDIERALNQNTDAAGVFITRPSYYGICSDIKKIADIVHSFGKVLAVDEAHGGHLVFSRRLPICAMKAGVDICVQSAHKTLPAFTQGAYLHINSERVDIERLRFFLRTFQTSSPSFIVLTLLDLARELMEKVGEGLLNKLLDYIEQFREYIESYAGLALLGSDCLYKNRLDKTRIVINVKKLGITGFEAEGILKNENNIQVEMSDLFNIVCIATISDDMNSIKRLAAGLAQLDTNYNFVDDTGPACLKPLDVPRQVLELKDIMQSEGEGIKLKNAAGRVCKEIVTPYPPGIPLVCPGEIITDEMVEYIYNIMAAGGNINGISGDFEISVVK
jgi:lysine decarboxylase